MTHTNSVDELEQNENRRSIASTGESQLADDLRRWRSRGRDQRSVPTGRVAGAV